MNTYGPGRTIFLSPCGRTFTQSVARELREQYDHLILVCGHYEGIDQRFIDACVDEEISMGDFVLTGGELPAMAVADAVCRMVPGVLPDAECFEEAVSYTHLDVYKRQECLPVTAVRPQRQHHALYASPAKPFPVTALQHLLLSL